jgi:hypothetical protein
MNRSDGPSGFESSETNLGGADAVPGTPNTTGRPTQPNGGARVVHTTPGLLMAIVLLLMFALLIGLVAP